MTIRRLAGIPTAIAGTEPPSARSEDRARVLGVSAATVALTLMALIIVTARVHTLTEPFERDITTSIMFGRELAAGARMYVDLIEFKPPGAFMVWQTVHVLTGTSVTAVGVTNILFSVLTLLGVYRAGRGVVDSRAGGLCAAMVWTLIGGELFLQANQPNIEVFMNAGIAWGAALWLTSDVRRSGWWRYALIGALLTFATLQKHHVLVLCGLLAVAWAAALCLERDRGVRRRGLIGLSIVGGTIVIAWILVAAYFAVQGRFEPFFDQLVRYASYYGATRGGSAHGEPGVVALLSNLREGLQPERLFPPALRFVLPVVIVAAIGIGTALWTPVARRAGLLMVAWIAGTFLLVALPGTFFPHYYQLWLPVIAVATGWGMAALYRALGLRRRGVIVTAMVFVPLVPQVVLEHVAGGPDDWSRAKYGPIFVETRELGFHLKRILRPEDTFYVWGVEPGVYYYADRRPASSIMWVHRLIYGPFRDRWSAYVLNDLKEKHPVLFIVQLPLEGREEKEHPILAWVEQHYVPAQKFHQAKFLPYVRRGSHLERELAVSDARAAAPPISLLPAPTGATR